MDNDGGPASRLRNLIRRVGANKNTEIEFATVISIAPLRVRVNNMRIDLEADDLVVSECLTDHTGVIVHADGTRETVTYEDGLKVGDRVLITEYNNGQSFAIIDRFA